MNLVCPFSSTIFRPSRKEEETGGDEEGTGEGEGSEDGRRQEVGSDRRLPSARGEEGSSQQEDEGRRRGEGEVWRKDEEPKTQAQLLHGCPHECGRKVGEEVPARVCL